MPSRHYKLFNSKLFQSILAIILVCVGAYLVTIFTQEFFWGQGYFHGTHYDFLAFFSAGHLALHGQIAQIYDPAILTKFQYSIVPHSVGAGGYMPFLNPPFVAVLLSPLALLSINTARVVWFLLNLGLVSLVAFWLVQRLNWPYAKPRTIQGAPARDENCFIRVKRIFRYVEQRKTVFQPGWWGLGVQGFCVSPVKGNLTKILLTLLIVCAYPVYQNLIEGQLSIILLAGSLLALWFGERQKLLLSGAFLSVLIIKPQLALFVGIGLVIFKQWRVLIGMAASSIAILALTLPITGLKLYSTYLHFSSGVISSHLNGAGAVVQSVWQGTLQFSIGINGMFTSLFGQANVGWVNSLTFTTIFGLLILYAMAIRKVKPGFGDTPQKLMLMASIALVLLVDPHAYAQDLILAFVLLPILLSLRPKVSTVLVFLAFIQLIIIDQHVPIHLVTISLLTLVITILIDVAKSYNGRQSIFHKLVIC